MPHYLTYVVDNPDTALSLIDTILSKFPDDVTLHSLANVNVTNGDEPEYTLDDYNADLDDISGVSDLVRGRTPEAEAWFKRPTTTSTARSQQDREIRAMIRDAVACPIKGCAAPAGSRCGSGEQSYPDFIHTARIQAWDKLG